MKSFFKTSVLPSGKVLRFDAEKHAYAVFNGSGVCGGGCSDGSSDAAAAAASLPLKQSKSKGLASDNTSKASEGKKLKGTREEDAGAANVGEGAESANDDEGIVCTSVSGVLDKCFPFDGLGVATKVASKSDPTVLVGIDPITQQPLRDLEGNLLKRRPTPQEVMAEWSTRATLGSNVHAFIEQQIQNLPLSPRMECQGEEHLYYPTASAAAAKVLEDYDPVAIELMIASPDLKLAGTIDFLGRNKKTGGLLVGDWKTSSSQFSEYRHFAFETPASADFMPHLANEKQRRYALQILIYGYLLRREGYLARFNQPVLGAEGRQCTDSSGDVFNGGGGGIHNAGSSPTQRTMMKKSVVKKAAKKSAKGDSPHTTTAGSMVGGGEVPSFYYSLPSSPTVFGGVPLSSSSSSSSSALSSSSSPHSLCSSSLVEYLPLEYGIIQMSKNIDGSVGVRFKKVTPLDIIPLDCAGECTADDVIRSLIGF